MRGGVTSIRDFFKSGNDEEVKISRDTCFKTTISLSWFFSSLCH